MARKGSVDEGKIAALPPQTIIGFHAENVKRLTLVDLKLEPTGAVIIGGQNEAGKSSIIDAVMYAFGGAASMPEKPVRDGRKEAVIELETQSLKIKRTIKPDGSTRVEITGKDGLGLGTGQAVADCLFSELTFDPLRFLQLKPVQQVEALRQMTGLDFAAQDAKHAELYDKRRQINADHERAKLKLTSIGEIPKDTPDAEQDPVALSAAVEKATSLHILRAEIIRKAGELKLGLARFAQGVGFVVHATDEKALDYFINGLRMGPDVDQARTALANAEATNRHVRNKKARNELALEVARLEKESKNLTYAMDEIEAAKQKATAEAKLPLPGLTFAADRLLYQNLPFDQASYAVRLKVSFSMAMAMNPKLRICLIRDGAMLDDKNRAALVQMAKDAGAQVWLEIVGEKGATLVMEDGAVKGK